MEENLERIELFDGKHAFLEMVFDDDTSYIIRAYDDDKNVVGVCYFDIEKFYQRQLSPEERLANVPYFGSFEKTPKTCEILTSKKDEGKYIIKDDLLLFKSHDKWKSYPLQWATCKLELIEIKRKDFFKVGLGSILIKKMENFAIENGCTKVYAHYQPIGEFASGSQKFYESNGYLIGYNNKESQSCATKILSQKNIATQKSNNKNGK